MIWVTAWLGSKAESSLGERCYCKEHVSDYTVTRLNCSQCSRISIVDCYRNKTRTAIEGIMQDVKTVAPHYETRVGKRKWNERMRRGERKEDE